MSSIKSNKFQSSFNTKKLEIHKRTQNFKPVEKLRVKNVRALKSGKSNKTIKPIVNPIKEPNKQHLTVKNTKAPVKSQVQTKILLKPKLQMKQISKSPPIKRKIASPFTVNSAVTQHSNIGGLGYMKSFSKMSKQSLSTNASSVVIVSSKQPMHVEKSIQHLNKAFFHNKTDLGDLTDKLTDHDRRALYNKPVGRRFMNTRKDAEKEQVSYYQRDIMQMLKNRMIMVGNELESVKKRLHILEFEKKNIEAIMFSSAV